MLPIRRPKISRTRLIIKGRIILMVVKKGRPIIKKTLKRETFAFVFPVIFEKSFSRPKLCNVSCMKADIVPETNAVDIVKRIDHKINP